MNDDGRRRIPRAAARRPPSTDGDVSSPARYLVITPTA